MTMYPYYLPMESESDFQFWTTYAGNMHIYFRVSSISVILMAIRNLRVLTTKFPAFGVLFDTLSKAKTDLFYFCIVITFYLIMNIVRVYNVNRFVVHEHGYVWLSDW